MKIGLDPTRSESLCQAHTSLLGIVSICGGHDDDAVSTGSGSDRVSIHETLEFTKPITRSLPLPVLTSSLCMDRSTWHDNLSKPDLTRDQLTHRMSIERTFERLF
jgi:hypothetical protein